MAYLTNYWKINEMRKYNYKHSNVSQHSPRFDSSTSQALS